MQIERKERLSESRNIMEKYLSFILSFFLFFPKGECQNPISPPGVYFADPSARVFSDGKLYLYGSTDESCDYWCSWKHDLMFTSDMKNWTMAKDVFASTGENDQVSYNESLLFAPDAIEKEGTFYMYYCQPDPLIAEGVAIAHSPTGPFTSAKALNTGRYNQIDPAVFIDDDGTAYYIWGQFSLKMAQLKPNMTELDTNTIQTDIITEKDHFFHEGAYLTKRNGIYYLVYADISREEKPTCIGYAMSTSPYGPYTYKGVIIDNNGCNPNNWNNHGSIVEFEGQWYVFYHRSTHGCKVMRKSCVEKINFLPDGTIPEVEMTSQGAGPPLNATEELDGASACLLHGNVHIALESSHNEVLTGFQDEDVAIFKYLDFGEGVESVTIKIRPKAGGEIILYADKPWHQRLASISIEPTDQGEKWKEIKIDVQPVAGVHALWLRARGAGNDLFDIDWIKFHK